jgi:hypothetical protein
MSTNEDSDSTYTGSDNEQQELPGPVAEDDEYLIQALLSDFEDIDVIPDITQVDSSNNHTPDHGSVERHIGTTAGEDVEVSCYSPNPPLFLEEHEQQQNSTIEHDGRHEEWMNRMLPYVRAQYPSKSSDELKSIARLIVVQMQEFCQRDMDQFEGFHSMFRQILTQKTVLLAITSDVDDSAIAADSVYRVTESTSDVQSNASSSSNTKKPKQEYKCGICRKVKKPDGITHVCPDTMEMDGSKFVRIRDNWTQTKLSTL